MRLIVMMLTAALLAPPVLAESQVEPVKPGKAVERIEAGNRISENLPDVPAELVEQLNRYQNTRGASFSGWLPDGSLAISTRFGETNQVHRVREPLGMREQITFYNEPLSAVTTTPGDNGFAFGKDVGGSEFWQLFWYDLDAREATMLTDGGRSQNAGPLFSKDSKHLAWASTARNGRDYDLWVRDLASGESRIVLQEGGMWRPADFSPDGKRLAMGLHTSAGDNIWIRSLPRGPLARLTFTTAPDYRPHWTTDGRAVTFVAPDGLYLRRITYDAKWGLPQI